MKPLSALVPWLAALPMGWTAWAGTAGCGHPRTPDPSAAQEGDAGELTCAERAKAGSICRAALTSRCESQGHDCASGCDANDLPANDSKTPTERNVLEADQCRQNCQGVRDACVRSAAERCPVPCE